jgi:hypothetical protein
MFNGRRQPSRGGTSRMMREYQVRFCERLGVKFPGPTRPQRPKPMQRACPRGTRQVSLLECAPEAGQVEVSDLTG